jgi:peptidyl-prolyl cis-trans isomerase SurA
MRQLNACLLTLIFLMFFLDSPLDAQTLFTYGENKVSKDEFLKAYSKNNTEANPTDKSYRDYLNLYIRYKLKVQAAYDLRMDTVASQKTELKNFKNQVADGYMTDEHCIDSLVNEAYERSTKDILLAHIYIAAPPNASPADTFKAYQKVTEAFDALKKGREFGPVAAEYSEDNSSRNDGGKIGWITVFSLPYELENLAYAVPAGQYSAIYRSRSGFHVFENLAQRDAIGKIKAAQILIPIPPGASDSVKAIAKQKADSIYTALMNGAKFAELAKKYSGDNLSYQTGGELADFGVGKFDSAFESAAFALSQDGEISKPVLTSFGYHIIKRIARKPVPPRTKEALTELKTRVSTDSRISVATNKFLKMIYAQTHFKRSPVNMDQFSIYTDSILQHKAAPPFPGLNEKTVLFTMGNKEFTVKQWIDYAKNTRNLSAMRGRRSVPEGLEKFIETRAFTYYRENLESYNNEFAYQLKEFKEGNLLFEVMQKKIWDKASLDSAGLKKYYNEHKDKYWWQPGADAILFTCNNEKSADNLKSLLTGNFSNWRNIADSLHGSIQADSGRFEQAQLPKSDNKLEAGQFSSMTQTVPDNTVSFTYVIKTYPEKSPRSYLEARGFVINDFQNFMEYQWIAQLKLKYPVKINEAVVSKLPK